MRSKTLLITDFFKPVSNFQPSQSSSTSSSTPSTPDLEREASVKTPDKMTVPRFQGSFHNPGINDFSSRAELAKELGYIPSADSLESTYVDPNFYLS